MLPVHQIALGQVTETRTVNWNWTYSVTPAAISSYSKTWPANPNPAPDYGAGPYNATGTVSATLNDPLSLPLGAQIISVTGDLPPSSIQLSLAVDFVSSNPTESVLRYPSKFNAANGVPFSLGDGESYDYRASGSVYFIKPAGGNAEPYVSSADFTLSLSLTALGPTSGTYTVTYQTMPEPESVAVLAGLPLVAWGIMRCWRCQPRSPV